MSYRRVSYDNLTPIWIIMIINLLVFIAVNIDGNLIRLLGLQRAVFLDQPWTIITMMFVHKDIWHLFFNMLSLYFLGSFLLNLIGESKSLLIYFFGGILGSIFCLLLTNSTVIGASGAIYALGGALVALVPRTSVQIFPIPVPMPLWVAILINFVILFPFTAWQAHLGGLIFGLIAGYYFRRRRRFTL